MAIALALTDTQLTVITRLRASIGAADLDELAAAAIEHDRRAAPDPRWREPRPRGPGAGRPQPPRTQPTRDRRRATPA